METHDDLDGVLALLERTPATLAAQLRGLPDESLAATEGPDTGSPLEVVAHLAHAERTNWIPRVRHVLDETPGPLPAFDRTAHRALLAEVGADRPLDTLLATFETRRGVRPTPRTAPRCS
ncbi:MAG: DUF664 domain-containing protein [Deinococcus-Thermus bacterium]|jgi:hypothetical protein|nr:DUF664 domain-containing protein [Deinococcota bacterium]